MKTDAKTILFVGCGAMGEAILASCLESGVYLRENITVAEADPAKRNSIARSYGVKTVPPGEAGGARNSFASVLVAVKPQQADSIIPVLESVKFRMLITIMAGVRCSYFTDRIGKIPVVRVMPNICIKVAKSLSALFANEYLKAEPGGKEMEKEAAEIFSASGEVIRAESEDAIDRVTAIAGSGPAYAAYFMEALEEAAGDLGFGKAEAAALSFKTFEGTLAYLARTGEKPGELRKKVTSPGGTTEAAIKIYEKNKLKETVSAGSLAAYERAAELGKKD